MGVKILLLRKWLAKNRVGVKKVKNKNIEPALKRGPKPPSIHLSLWGEPNLPPESYPGGSMRQYEITLSVPI